MKNVLHLVFLFLLGLSSLGQAQITSPKDPLNLFQIKTWTGFYTPGRDLADRFGPMAQVGLELSYQLKSGWVLGAGAGHIFGNNVRERDIMSNIATTNGDIITEDGVFENYRLRPFGWSMYGRIGKIFPLFGPNVNSGLMVDLGVGIMQHKIWIETPRLASPQLSGDYKKGYDRLTNGLSLNQFIGYQYLSNKKLINFYVGFDFHQGFTQNRRTVNFNTGVPDTRNRLDLLVGLKAGWILPLYGRDSKEMLFY